MTLLKLSFFLLDNRKEVFTKLEKLARGDDYGESEAKKFHFVEHPTDEVRDS